MITHFYTLKRNETDLGEDANEEGCRSPFPHLSCDTCVRICVNICMLLCTYIPITNARLQSTSITSIAHQLTKSPKQMLVI